jgi:uncharacterized glyoxalase superfamily protein PhnB
VRPYLAAGAGGEPPSDRLAGSRTATVRDPFGLTWWLAATVGQLPHPYRSGSW